ncbi:hypothetical protein Acsp01_79960 [Actinoplanes sp. NBRC 101535]|nr:hypothetical protein Acsp01_79960 [Actinoplanes sp. NBRC 101535]
MPAVTAYNAASWSADQATPQLPQAPMRAPAEPRTPEMASTSERTSMGAAYVNVLDIFLALSVMEPLSGGS